MTLVQLIWNDPIDDHPRPDTPLWKRFAYPLTRRGLLLWMDGTVLQVDSVEGGLEASADFRITGLWYGDDTEWQSVVLANAGYTLVPIPAVNDPISGGDGS